MHEINLKEKSYLMVGFGKVNTISQVEAKKQIEKNENIIIIDVRAEHEFANGHIKDAINIPFEYIPEKVIEQIDDKEQKIFVNCLVGSKSKSAVALIRAHGYTNVYDIGGISTWKYGLYL